MAIRYGAGLKKTDPVFVGGHSLGGAMVQDWTFKQAGKIKGQVLMGATLLRKYVGVAQRASLALKLRLTNGKQVFLMNKKGQLTEAGKFWYSEVRPGQNPHGLQPRR